MKRVTMMLVLLLLFSSCASLPVLEISKDMGSGDIHYYYDMDSKLAYSINVDEDHIYINLKTDNENTIRSMFRKGLYVYFDPNGRKSNSIFFHYPISAEMGSGLMPRGQMKKGQMSGEGRQTGNFTPPVFNVHTLIDAAEMEAIFSYKDMAEKLPVYSQKTDIAVTVTSPQQGLLLYELRMPVDRLEKEDISEICIGIVSGEIEMPSMSGGMPQGGGGMPSGGMQGGRPGGAGPGGDPSGRPDAQAQGMNLQDINIWFKVNLTEHNN